MKKKGVGGFFGGGHKSFDKQNKTEQKMFPTSKTEIILFRNLIFYHLLNVICLRLLFFDFFLGGGCFCFNFFLLHCVPFMFNVLFKLIIILQGTPLKVLALPIQMATNSAPTIEITILPSQVVPSRARGLGGITNVRGRT